MGRNTKTDTHKIRSACAGRATKASLLWGGGDNCVCLCVQWVTIRLQVFATVSGPRRSQVSFISRVTHCYYIEANPHCCDKCLFIWVISLLTHSKSQHFTETAKSRYTLPTFWHQRQDNAIHYAMSILVERHRSAKENQE